jgi:two-component system, LytTR family, sensor kinase
MFMWGLEFMSPRNALVNKVLLVATGFALTLLFRKLFQKLRTISRSAAVHIAALLATSFLGAAIWRGTHSLLFQIYLNVKASRTVSVQFPMPAIGTFLYDGFVLSAWSLLYFGINNWMQLSQERERAIKAEGLAQAARLRALQSQLEPHFLFNTLNAVSSLVVSGKNGDAARMITRLSDFLRLTLDTINTPEISLVEEFEFLRRYLEIEQIRFGDRLQINIDADPDVMSGMVPALILQPLVENAVKHGVFAQEEGGTVSITAERRNGALRLCVADSGRGVEPEKLGCEGVGLSNTVTRLRELYGDQASFSLGQSPRGGLQAAIEIPLRASAANRASGDVT